MDLMGLKQGEGHKVGGRKGADLEGFKGEGAEGHDAWYRNGRELIKMRKKILIS